MEIIKEKLGDQNTFVARIGSAAENISKISCIMNERRAAGRKGLIAVVDLQELENHKRIGNQIWQTYTRKVQILES